MTQEQNIVFAIIRCVIANNLNTATKHQIERLVSHYVKNDMIGLAIQIEEMLLPPNEDDNFKIIQS